MPDFSERGLQLPGRLQTPDPAQGLPLEDSWEQMAGTPPAKERQSSASSEPPGKPCPKQFMITFRTHFQLIRGRAWVQWPNACEAPGKRASRTNFQRTSRYNLWWLSAQKPPPEWLPSHLRFRSAWIPPWVYTITRPWVSAEPLCFCFLIVKWGEAAASKSCCDA